MRYLDGDVCNCQRNSELDVASRGILTRKEKSSEGKRGKELDQVQRSKEERRQKLDQGEER